MNKVITINLNGIAYQIEENGYDTLCLYLERAEAQLKDNPDRAEILSDLEQAIGEKCRNYLNAQKNVVTAAEIERIILEMGPVDGGSESAGHQASSGTPPNEKQHAAGSTSSETKPPKRLFRIKEGKMIEGVCMGLAVYFGIDVTIVRLICVVLAVVTGGIAIGGYLVMIVVVPLAQTPDDNAAAYGTQFNAQEVIDHAKQHYAEFKKDSEEWRKRAKEKQREWQQSWRNSFGRPRYRWRPSAPSPGPMMADVSMPIFGVLIGVMTLIGVFAIISVISTHAVFGWPLPLRLPVWLAIVIILLLLNVVTGPFRYMWHAGYGHPHGAIAAFWSSLAWLAVLIALGWLAFRHAPELQNFLENLPNLWDELVHH